jgi:hypothetical protein
VINRGHTALVMDFAHQVPCDLMSDKLRVLLTPDAP